MNGSILHVAILDVSVLWGFLRCSGSILVVGLIVELLEEEEEHDGVHPYPPHEGTGVVAVDEEQLEGVDHDTHKLGLWQKSSFEVCLLKVRMFGNSFFFPENFTVFPKSENFH